MVTELLSGNVDAAYYVKPGDIPALAADPRFRLYFQWVTSEPQAIYWNHQHPFLSDPVVRQALRAPTKLIRNACVVVPPFPLELPTRTASDPARKAVYPRHRATRSTTGSA